EERVLDEIGLRRLRRRRFGRTERAPDDSERPKPRRADERGGVVEARAHGFRITARHAAERLARFRHAPGPEALVAELAVEPALAPANAVLWRSRVLCARAFAERRRLFDDELLAAIRFFHGAAHRSAGSMHGERTVEISDRMARGDAQPKIPVLH